MNKQAQGNRGARSVVFRGATALVGLLLAGAIGCGPDSGQEQRQQPAAKSIVLPTPSQAALQPTSQPATNSGTERLSRHQQIQDIEKKKLVDDWDYFWLMDRSKKMTAWHPRVSRGPATKPAATTQPSMENTE